MASSYDVYSEYETKDGVVSVVPSWCLLVIRFANIVTLDRAGLGNDDNFVTVKTGDASTKDLSPSDAANTKKPLIIASDCIQLTTQTSKGSHISSLSATLINSNINYLAEIMPGDWVMAWIANSQDSINNVISRLKNLEACNGFDDGLKFIGRVQSIRKSGQIDRGTGILRTRYHLQAVGFKELDTTIFYEPALQRKFIDMGDWVGALQKVISDFIFTDTGITISKAMPLLVNILLGEGLPTSISNPILTTGFNPPAISPATTGLDAPFAYVVPKEVVKLLGAEISAKQSGVPCYADILQLLMGRQRYTDGKEFVNHENGDTSFSLLFTPDSTSGDSNHKTCGDELSGTFLPQIPQFSNRTIWSILSQFLNPAINEMYTCLRVDDSNRIMPTLIVRQLPFSSPQVANVRDDVTPFHELPRWLISKQMVYSYEVGRSNAMRFNFIHVYGMAPLAQDNDLVRAESIIRAPPIRDSLDIQRNGLHGDFMEVACDIDEQLNGPSKWMHIRADFQMGLHLSLNGTMRIQGIQGPICEGDNLEFDGVVYHIESVTHNCTIDFSGRRAFETLVTLTHGMNVDVDLENDDSLFPAVASDTGLTSLDPGRSYEGTETESPTENE